jgi:CDP-diacylglycerol--serine O-phosphatidyltransferase
VVHTNLVVVANYFLVLFVGSWNGWVAGLLILAVGPLMVSNYKSYKTDIGHGLAACLAGASSRPVPCSWDSPSSRPPCCSAGIA